MTDVSANALSLVGRLGVTSQLVDGRLILTLKPQPEVTHHGLIRASVLAFLIDVAAGIAVDDDPNFWTLTSDMSVRMRPEPVAGPVEALCTVLRRGRRSAICTVEVTGDGSTPVATGAIGFAKIPRRPGDPPRPQLTPENSVSILRGLGTLSSPLRKEAGIEVLDPKRGEVQLEVTPELRNPVGTLQGALVALVAEAAAEDLVSTRFESPAVVTELDLRYLAQARVGPVRTRSRLLGDSPDSPVEVELVDTSVDRVATLVYARAHPVPG